MHRRTKLLALLGFTTLGLALGGASLLPGSVVRGSGDAPVTGDERMALHGTMVAGEHPGDPPTYVPSPKKHVLPPDVPDPSNPPEGTRVVVEPGSPTSPPAGKPALVVDPSRVR